MKLKALALIVRQLLFDVVFMHFNNLLLVRKLLGGLWYRHEIVHTPLLNGVKFWNRTSADSPHTILVDVVLFDDEAY